MRLTAVVFFGVASMAFGQDSGKTTFFASMDACLRAADEDVNEYQPVFTDNLAKWQQLVQNGKAQLVSDGDNNTYCVIEWSMEGKVAGKHIIRWPANNPYFKGDDGKIADGRCGNTVYEMREIPPTPTPPAPPQITCNCPPIQLPTPPPDILLSAVPPPLQLPPEEHYSYIIVVDKGHKFPIPCIPREKGWYGIGLPIVECAALGFGAYEAFGAFQGGMALVKIAAPVISNAP